MEVNDLVVAGKPRQSVDKHAAGAANSHATGGPPGKSSVLVLLDPVQSIENRHPLCDRHGILAEIGRFIFLGIIAQYFETNSFDDIGSFRSGMAHGCTPFNWNTAIAA
jgi:hypothetical protein